MKRGRAETSRLAGIAIFLGCLMASCAVDPPDSSPALPSTAMYPGQQPPGETPQPFAPGIVNTDAIELNGVVSPDGGLFEK